MNSTPPKVISFQNVDRCREFGMFFKILPKSKSILETDLPIPVILTDSISKNQYPAKLQTLISFNGFILPDLFCQLSDRLSPEEMESNLKVKFPNLEIHNFAFYIYEFETMKHE